MVNPRTGFPFSNPRDNPGYLLWQVTMRWQRLMNQALTPHELTHTQFVLLAALKWLSGEQDIVTKSDVARHANVDRIMAAKILRDLARRKIISERPHPTRGHAQAVSLTNEGGIIFGDALDTVGNTDRLFFGDKFVQSVTLLNQLLPEDN